MTTSRKLLSVLGAAGLAAGLGLAQSDDAAAFSRALEIGDQEAIETFLRQNPTSEHAPDALMHLVARFKDRTDHGRPDAFGPPGRPEIGPPGQYEG